jgi:hypothetical protein
MAESRRIYAHPLPPLRRPGARPPLQPVRPPRIPLGETPSLAARPLPSAPPEALKAPERAPDPPSGLKPPRSQAEKVLLGVLLLSLGLNLAAFLVFGGLTRTDGLFATVILASGAALLVLAEINRRSSRSSD